MTTHRTLRTADIIASQLQQHNGGLLEEVTGAVLMAEPDMWAGFTVTDNDGMRYRVLVTPAAESGLSQIPPETSSQARLESRITALENALHAHDPYHDLLKDDADD